MKTISVLVASALCLAACGTEEVTRITQKKPEYNMVIARVPAGSPMNSTTQPETRVVNVTNTEQAQSAQAIGKLYDQGKPVVVSAAPKGINVAQSDPNLKTEPLPYVQGGSYTDKNQTPGYTDQSSYTPQNDQTQSTYAPPPLPKYTDTNPQQSTYTDQNSQSTYTDKSSYTGQNGQSTYTGQNGQSTYTAPTKPTIIKKEKPSEDSTTDIYVNYYPAYYWTPGFNNLYWGSTGYYTYYTPWTPYTMAGYTYYPYYYYAW